MRRLVGVLAIVVILAPLGALAQPFQVDPAYADRYHDLLKELRCLVCQNESLAESQADLAQDLRGEIGTRMEAGASNDQIIAYLADRYGDFVLYRPPVKPKTYLLWFTPFILLLVALPWLIFRLRQRARRGDTPLTEEEQGRLRELLHPSRSRDST